jgi:hypothetical protein
MKAINHKEFSEHVGEKCKIITFGMHFPGEVVSADSVQIAPGGLYGGMKLTFSEATVYVNEK